MYQVSIIANNIMGKQSVKLAIYNSIINYMLKNGYPPTMREIGDMAGLKSTCSVSQYMIELKEAGVIDYDPYASRTIKVPGISYCDYRIQLPDGKEVMLELEPVENTPATLAGSKAIAPVKEGENK